MAEKIKVRNMEWHRKVLTGNDAELLRRDEDTGRIALDALTADKQHPGLVLGIYRGRLMKALIVFENIPEDGRYGLKLRLRCESEDGICEAAEASIKDMLRGHMEGAEVETAEYGDFRLIRKKSQSCLRRLVPLLMILSFGVLYMQVFENRAAGFCTGIGIGLCMAPVMYRRFSSTIIEVKEDAADAADE